uniref:Uncharacterized protein n=1 Tax=Arundo donax TaxID=35708 RepID=A0A0A9DBP1_ARUDO
MLISAFRSELMQIPPRPARNRWQCKLGQHKWTISPRLCDSMLPVCPCYCPANRRCRGTCPIFDGLWLPVKRTLSHLCSMSFSPTSAPPSTTFTALGSRYFGKLAARNAAVDGASSDGFTTTALPAAKAPESGSITKPIRFQQEKVSTTPSGSGTTNAVTGKATNDVSAFSGAAHLLRFCSLSLTDFARTPTSSLKDSPGCLPRSSRSTSKVSSSSSRSLMSPLICDRLHSMSLVLPLS